MQSCQPTMCEADAEWMRQRFGKSERSPCLIERFIRVPEIPGRPCRPREASNAHIDAVRKRVRRVRVAVVQPGSLIVVLLRPGEVAYPESRRSIRPVRLR